ncbi:serine hydrolase domain-containing protein [Micromonospora sp. NPDC047074]|uniref:serine hydrolase domain-containing protein n=1 Tax=Micromonospora sp. NPDC047074 TaxID=3154339 RepID=UPI0033F435D9
MLVHALVALALAVPAVPAPTPATGPAVDAASIDAVVRAYREVTRTPGVAVAVTRGRDVVHAAGYGRTADGTAVTDRTVMPIASLSKSITALAVLRLVDAGRVRLDAPVRDHLPEFTMADSRAATLTVRQLLDHTSGMSDTTYRSFSGPRLRTLAEAVASMRTARLAADPGTRFEYHNPNYQVAARLVEVVGGEPFDVHLRRHVFSPLGMTDSRTVDTADDLPSPSRGHRMIAGAAVALPEPAAFGNGSGGVLSTARDLAAWLIAQHDQSRGAGTPLVSPAAVAELRRPSALSSYALGWNVGETPSGAPLVDHTGDLITFTAYQAVLPATGHGVAVLANSGSQYGDAVDLGAQLVDLIEGRPVPSPASPTPLVAIDAVLLLCTVGVGVLAVRGVRRSRRWAEAHRPGPVAVARLVPYLLPLPLLVTLHRVVGFLYRGRDVSWSQSAYLYPTFTLLLAAGSLAGVVVVVARLVRCVSAWRVRCPPGPAPRSCSRGR